MIDSNIKNANILIVDDQVAYIDVLRSFLEFQGYTSIKTTTDPRMVVELYDTFKPDLILLDLMMPFLNGYEVMEQLKKLIPPGIYLPMLVLTADLTTEAKQRALKNGANDFLTKPYDLTEVDLRIRNLLYINYLQQQLLLQNQLLEEKVKERTSELENTKQELIISRDKAEASDRLKTAFIQNISNEIRTPLNGILGFSDLLADPNLKAEEKKQIIPLLQSSSNRLVNTITDYVNIALIVSGNMEVNYQIVSVTSTLQEFKHIFKESCKIKGLEFNLQIPQGGEEVTLQTDLVLFKSIISHLLENAIKFTYQGKITIGYALKPEHIEFFVEDTGIGVQEDAREKIFEIFMQEDVSITRGHEGNGLGLSIVRGLLTLLGGKIYLESKKGEGTTFYFTLPIAPNLADKIS